MRKLRKVLDFGAKVLLRVAKEANQCGKPAEGVATKIERQQKRCLQAVSQLSFI